MTNLPAEAEALILAELLKRVKARTNLVRATIPDYRIGQKETFRSPIDDRRLGSVYRTDPDPEWRIVDPFALDEWLAGQDEYTETTVEVREGCEAEAFAILEEHAPHVLEEVGRIQEFAATRAVDWCRINDKPLPGIEKVKPEGVLNVRPDPNAGTAIEAMIAAGVLTWDGQLAVEAGK